MKTDLTQFMTWKSKNYTLSFQPDSIEVQDRYFNVVAQVYRVTGRYTIAQVLTLFGFKQGEQND